MELVSLTATSLTLFASTFYITQDEENDSSLVLAILSFALLIGNIAVMVWFAWKIMGAGVRSWLRTIGAMHHTETKVCRTAFLWAQNINYVALYCPHNHLSGRV